MTDKSNRTATIPKSKSQVVSSDNQRKRSTKTQARLVSLGRSPKQLVEKFPLPHIATKRW